MYSADAVIICTSSNETNTFRGNSCVACSRSYYRGLGFRVVISVAGGLSKSPASSNLYEINYVVSNLCGYVQSSQKCISQRGISILRRDDNYISICLMMKVDIWFYLTHIPQFV